MSEEKLKACSCGGEGIIEHFRLGYSIYCNKCRFQTYAHRMKNRAIDEWNDNCKEPKS